MEFFVLGPVGATHHNKKISLGGEKQKTVLAALLLARGKIVSNRRLTELLWGNYPPKTSTAQIYTYMSRLRKQIGRSSEIEFAPPGYMMHIGQSWLDLGLFQLLEKTCREELGAHHYDAASQHARDALALWTGPALSSTSEVLREDELPWLEEARMGILEHRIEADLALGQAARLVAELTRLVSQYPLREKLRANLMIALYQTDRQADAIATFHQGKALLEEEFGIDPSAVLRETYQAVLECRPALDPPSREPVTLSLHSPETSLPGMLPANTFDFVGRKNEQAVLDRLADPGSDQNSRIIFISGMAGIGKSALAIRGANTLTANFQDGQLYADLGGSKNERIAPSAVLECFLQALGVRHDLVPADEDERVRLYRSKVAGRRVLVLLDNAVDEQQVRPLLPGGDRCRTIVTSRRTLGALNGIHLTPLECLDTQESLAMLTAIVGHERIMAERGPAERIARYCGGLPLAIHVVASRLLTHQHVPLTQVADDLSDPGYWARFAVHDPDVRIRLASIYRDLPAHERAAFKLLATTGHSIVTSQTVASLLNLTLSNAETILDSLADTGLVTRDTLQRNGDLVFRFHSLLTTFARGASPVLSRRPGFGQCA